MRKASVYFKGKLVCIIDFEKIEHCADNTLLTKGYGQDRKVLAIVPISHLITID